MRPAFDLSFYLVLDPALCADFGLIQTARAAVANGARMVQLRDKRADTARMIQTGLDLKQALAGTGALLIVNDDVDAAVAIGADGLHLGQDDVSIYHARERLGPGAILGLSVEKKELAASVDPALVDYAGVGPVFATATKPDHKQPIGMAGLAEIVAFCPVPAVAIGGLKTQHVSDVFMAGARGVAVVSAVCGTSDPGAAARNLSIAIAKARP